MELLFYHLERASLERVLPDLLSKSLDKGWRAVVETAEPSRIDVLDGMLWTYNDESFLPHGTIRDENASEQQVLITDQPGNDNKADIRFFIDSGDVTAHEGYARLVYIFNGNDEDVLMKAREQWKLAKAVGLEATYWQQSPEGRWEKKA